MDLCRISCIETLGLRILWQQKQCWKELRERAHITLILWRSSKSSEMSWEISSMLPLSHQCWKVFDLHWNLKNLRWDFQPDARVSRNVLDFWKPLENAGSMWRRRVQLIGLQSKYNGLTSKGWALCFGHIWRLYGIRQVFLPAAVDLWVANWTSFYNLKGSTDVCSDTFMPIANVFLKLKVWPI